MLSFILHNVMKSKMFFVDGINRCMWKPILVRKTVCPVDINLGCLNDMNVWDGGNVVACKNSCLVCDTYEFWLWCVQ
jgi:hypothetical protein